MSNETSTVGAALQASPAIQQAFDTIVAEVRERTAAITDVKPANPALKESYEDLMARAGKGRGRPLLYPYVGSGAGNGALVELADGSVKWDLVGGIGVHFMGHSHPTVIRAQLESSLEDTTKHGNLQSGAIPFHFNERLIRLAGKNSKLAHSFLTTSGAMANELALKVCLQKNTPADRVIAFKHAFMGRSLTMTSIGDSAAARDGLPINMAVDYMPFWSEVGAQKLGGKDKFIEWATWQLRQYIGRYPGRHAAFIFELIQGEGGFNTAPREYFEALMKVCKEAGIAVWVDEIQTFGRTTEMFAFDAYGLGEYVDVCCVGKMTHACAALYTEEYNPRPGLLSGTFTGATVDFKVGEAILKELETGAQEHGGYYGEGGLFDQHQQAFRAEMKKLVDKHPEWFPTHEYVPEPYGGIGGMMRFTPFAGEKAKIVAAAKAIYEEGAVLFWCGHGPFHIRMLPPMPGMKLADYPRFFEIIERGLARAAEG